MFGTHEDRRPGIQKTDVCVCVKFGKLVCVKVSTSNTGVSSMLPKPFKYTLYFVAISLMGGSIVVRSMMCISQRPLFLIQFLDHFLAMSSEQIDAFLQSELSKLQAL